MTECFYNAQENPDFPINGNYRVTQ